LTSLITTIDRYYLEDEDLARRLVEFGVHGKGDIYSREDFEAKKETNDRVKKARA
jgi:AAA15 family ATPase/GTPase